MTYENEKKIMGVMVTMCILYSFVAIEAQEIPKVVCRPPIERRIVDPPSLIDLVIRISASARG